MRSEGYERLIDTMVDVLSERLDDLALFYEPSLAFARRLLDANRRDEAGRFEPLHEGENRQAYARTSAIDWARYPYAAIIVPGAGAEHPDVRLSPAGKLRTELAAVRARIPARGPERSARSMTAARYRMTASRYFTRLRMT